MNAQCLRDAGIDYDRGVKRFAGRAQLYEKALSKFPRDGTFSRIRAARAAGDTAQLLSGAHEFKGMCGNIGLETLYQTADEIVRMLRSGAYEAAALSDVCERLEAEYCTAYDAVLAATEDGK